MPEQVSCVRVVAVRRLLLFFAAGIIAGLFAGCDPGSVAGERAPVRGQVRFQGRPLPGGTIVFAPDQDRNSARELAVAQIRYDGSYELQIEQGSGVVPGWYRISVTASNPALRLPPKYRDPVLSGLEREVRAGQANVIDLDLK
jgi:hypothetical protein